MAKRPSLAGNTDKRSDADVARDEITARDQVTTTEDDGAPEVETLPGEGASDGVLAKSDSETDGTGLKPEYEDDEARTAIIASYAKNRDKVPTFEEGDEEPEDEAAPGASDGKEPAPAVQEPPAARAVPAAANADDPLIKIKVDGVEIELPRSEIIAKAQMNLAADARLREANSILDAAKAANSRPAPTAAQPDNAGVDKGATPAPDTVRRTKRDPSQLIDVVDRLQAGSPEEGAVALAELLETVENDREARQSPQDVATTVNAALLNRDAHNDVQQALAATAQEFPDIAKANDPDLPDLMARKVDREVSAQLKTLGYTDAELNVPLGDKINGYARLRRDPAYPDGRKLTDIKEIFRKVSTEIQDKYVRPRTVPEPSTEPGKQPGRVGVSPERAARKAQVQPQPRSASVRTDMTQIGQANKRRDPSTVVQDMARSRGQLSA